ncbi:uncharacterized protein N7498_000812 [Penicillium cinerascens]|uniref:Uncharacterized protein n=1 Tax=Penicillium cinerascens TaxID=70096 RepID=A0A9W9NF92_9EURO|nr:uncharacterized protein N7498_000812 [Penicillium cinerascens]KAJ5218713.1 hypothetical protein N7498_000812 [Penicillium cinerascens]
MDGIRLVGQHHGPRMGFTAASLGSNRRIGPKRSQADELCRPQLASSASPMSAEIAEYRKIFAFVGYLTTNLACLCQYLLDEKE